MFRVMSVNASVFIFRSSHVYMLPITHVYIKKTVCTCRFLIQLYAGICCLPTRLLSKKLLYIDMIISNVKPIPI